MESCKRWINVYIEFIEIVDVMVFGIYRERMIILLKGVSNVLHRDWEFSSYKIELRNQVTQNDFTFQVANMKICIEILPSSYWRLTSSKLKNIKFHFELQTFIFSLSSY